MTEKELVENAKNGDLHSLEKLLKKYSPYIKRIAMSVCGSNSSLADDVHSETMISIFKNVRKFKSISKFSTWFYKIASNHCYMKYREMKKEKSIFYDEFFIENQNRNQTYEDFYKALSQTPLIYRNPIILVDIEGMSLKDAATNLGITIAALKSRLFRGRRIFKKKLEELEKS